MVENNYFNAIDEKGIESTYQMLYCKVIDGKSIVWYTDGSVDDKGKYNIYISSYKEKDKVFLLDSINNDEEIKKYINIFKKELSIR